MEYSKNHLSISHQSWFACLMMLAILAACLGCNQLGEKVDRPLLTEAHAASGNQLALQLRNHVVSIIAERSRNTEYGFGFIVGDREGVLYIVTANHVVRSNQPGDVTKRVMVRYFHDQGQMYEAKLLETSDSRYDLAVLQAKVPTALQGYRKSWGHHGGVRDGMQVWFVGRAREWYVPSSPSEVTKVTLDCKIHATTMSVQPGTSGAPLITEGSIVGMIINDDGTTSEAVCIDIIKTAFERWNLPWNFDRGDEPIKLAIFPWYLTGSAENYKHMIHEALKSVLDETKASVPVLSYYEDPSIISAENVSKIWNKKGWSLAIEPNLNLISQVGKQLKVYVVLMYALDVRENISQDLSRPPITSPYIEVFLVDVEKNQKHSASGQITDFIQDRYTEVRRLTKKVFLDYKSVNRQ
ncbi:MAG: S1 family peptidase [Candidatus Entotheonellia bacterium]